MLIRFTTLAALVLVTVSTAHADNRAAGAAKRVVRHLRLYSHVAPIGALVRDAEQALSVAGTLRMRRSGLGAGAWENRVRCNANQELYWQTVRGTVFDVRILKRSVESVLFAMGRNSRGELDTWGELKGKRAEVTKVSQRDGRTIEVKKLKLEQLSPHRIAYQFAWRLPGDRKAKEYQSVLQFSEPVSVSQLTTEAAATPQDYMADYRTAPRLPQARSEGTGQQLQLGATDPVTDLMLHGSEAALAALDLQ